MFLLLFLFALQPDMYLQFENVGDFKSVVTSKLLVSNCELSPNTRIFGGLASPPIKKILGVLTSPPVKNIMGVLTSPAIHNIWEFWHLHD